MAISSKRQVTQHVYAAKPLTLTITKEDTTGSLPDNAFRDPIASSLLREGYPQVEVLCTRARVHTKDKKTNRHRVIHYKIGRKLRKAIKEFDEGGSFPMGTYVLSPRAQVGV